MFEYLIYKNKTDYNNSLIPFRCQQAGIPETERTFKTKLEPVRV
jgi:hypothetical protein